MIQHNHAQDNDCTELSEDNPTGCPAYGTPWEALVPQESATFDLGSVGQLRLLAQADGAEATNEQQTREEKSWELHVNGHEAATFHNHALGLEHAGKATLYEAAADAVHVLTSLAAVAVLVRLFRKGARA